MKEEQYGHIKQGRQSSNKFLLLFIFLSLFGLALWAFAVFFVVSVLVGQLYDFHFALGKPLTLFGFKGYGPFTMLSWPNAVWDAKEANTYLQVAWATLVLPPVIVGALCVQMTQKKTNFLHGSAHWASKKEIEDMGYFGNQGVYVGGWWNHKTKELWYLRENGPIHILCFAPTRSGKGVGLIQPTLLSWPDSSVVLDIKGENFANTSGYNQSQGHRIFRFDPSDASGKSSRYNPLEEIRIDSQHCIADTQQVANMVMDPDGKGLEDYWSKAAIGFFPAVVLYGIIRIEQDKGRRASLTDISMMLEDPNRQKGTTGLFTEMVKGRPKLDANGEFILDEKGNSVLEGIADVFDRLWPDATPKGLSKQVEDFCRKAAAGMLDKADKERAGVVSQATSNLSLYGDPVVADNISQSDFSIHDLMNSKMPVNLYLVVSPADIDRLRPLLRIFTAQLLGRLTERMEFTQGSTKKSYNHRLLLMFDEFTSLGKLAIVERAIAYMAGYGLKGYFIVQDTKQLNQTYGQDNALMANCHVRIAYAPNLPETAEYLSKLAGTTTVVQQKRSKSTGKGGGSVSVNEQETARPLLTPDECLRLPGIHTVEIGGKKTVESGDMLIFTAGNPAIYGKQILHFKDAIFMERVKYPAPDDTRLKITHGCLQIIKSRYDEMVELLDEKNKRIVEEEAKRYSADLPEHVKI